LLQKNKGKHQDPVTEKHNFILFHCSGEAAFKTLSIPFGWARNPMIHRVKQIDQSIPMTIVYGSRSWVDNSTGQLVKFIRSDSYVDVQVCEIFLQTNGNGLQTLLCPRSTKLSWGHYVISWILPRPRLDLADALSAATCIVMKL
jgi:hypothetical protein